MRYLFIILILFSCTKDIEPEVEEVLSSKPGTTIQDLINKAEARGGAVRIRGNKTEDISIPEGVEVIIKDTLFGHVVMNGGKISGTIVTTSGYVEAITVNSGVNVIECNINSYSSAIVTQGGKTMFAGNITSLIDYGVRNSGGEFYGSGNVFSKYNSALHNSGGDSYSEFTGNLTSEQLFPFEMSGGSAKLINANLVAESLDNIEGSGISKYGGDKLQLDNVRITCTAIGAYSIEKQGVEDRGVIELLSTCYANRPVADGLNIENKNLLIIQ